MNKSKTKSSKKDECIKQQMELLQLTGEVLDEATLKKKQLEIVDLCDLVSDVEDSTISKSDSSISESDDSTSVTEDELSKIIEESGDSYDDISISTSTPSYSESPMKERPSRPTSKPTAIPKKKAIHTIIKKG